MGRGFWIDTDTASDDAVALVMALRNPLISVEAITVVAGNVPLEQGVQNALYTRDLCGSSAPVFAGRSMPLARPLETAQFVHGEDGMGDIGLSLKGREPNEGDAVEMLIESIMHAPGEITLVTLGPLTNVAAALMKEPEIAHNVAACYVMGGKGAGPGNITPVAEYNFWVDPEAASIAARSGMPLHMVGWDMSVRHATFGPVDAEELRATGALGAFCVDIQATLDRYAREESGLDGFDLPDPIAIAVAIDPTIANFENHRLEILTEGGDRGRDVIDWNDSDERPERARIATRVDRDAFVAQLHNACRDKT
jgi:purine nucleosidase